jgi:hypothetical protein
MSEQKWEGEASLQQQVDHLRDTMAVNRTDIDSLMGRADAADVRADQSDARADRSELRADESEALSRADRLRIDDLEDRADVDRALIAELQDEGVIRQEQVANLERALRTSRTIGAALGIVMANLKVNEADAFKLLSKVSQDGNRKLRAVADDIVTTGDVDGLRAH